ncbi:unnamed protein product, partial [Didymodactylos carnosus]
LYCQITVRKHIWMPSHQPKMAKQQIWFLFILPNSRKDRYDALKTFLCLDKPISSQYPSAINTNLNQLQLNVNEVNDIMRNNLVQILDRGQNLDQLQNQSENLQYQASQLQQTAGKVKSKLWWNNLKWWVILIVLIIVILVIIVIVLAVVLTRGNTTKNG